MENVKETVIQLFPKAVYLSTYEKDISKETEFIENIEYTNRTGDDLAINTRSVDTYIIRCKELENINTFCQNQINHYQKEIMKSSNKLVITQSWINKNIKGKYHHKHSHANSILSGVFYFKSNNTAPIIFAKKPQVLELNYHSSNDYNCNSYVLLTEPRQLVIFPSTMLHYVPENCEEETRFSLSFNTFAVDMGREEGLTHFSIKDVNDQNI